MTTLSQIDVCFCCCLQSIVAIIGKTMHVNVSMDISGMDDLGASDLDQDDDIEDAERSAGDILRQAVHSFLHLKSEAEGTITFAR